jgi:hypothetical protein
MAFEQTFAVLRDWVSNNEVVTYLWAAGTTFWGAVVSYFDKDEPFAWRKFFAHFSSAAFAGLMVYLLCQASNVEGPMVGVLCGIASHMGTPAIIKLLKKNKSVAAFFGDGSEEKKDA